MITVPEFDWRKAVSARASRFQDFQDLMRERVQDILLVSSPYDSFILEEDGQLYELILTEFLDLDLRHTPGIRRVPSGAEALALAREQSRYNLIITTTHVGDMNAVELARRAKQIDARLPVILLAYDHRELTDFAARNDVSGIDGIFLWQGDARILLAIVKYVEDKLNVAHDTAAAGVQVIIVVEDNVRYYSSFLPVIYTELLHHSHRLISEGVNLSHKIMRMRARPKILLCGTFEKAWEFFTTYEEDILGIISDIEFPRGGELYREAGVDLARMVKVRHPDVPIMLHSSRPENEALAQSVGASFLLKGSPVLLNELRRFIVESLSFGDFVFRLPDGTEVGRAHDLKALEEKLQTVPAESIAYHGERNHFSNWLKARTEFALADGLRPRKVSDFPTHEALRRNLVESIAEYRRELGRGIIADFDRSTFDASSPFTRIGGGSLGGKARGLAFVRQLLHQCGVTDRFPGVKVVVPQAVVLGTAVFDRFLEKNDLRDFAINADDDETLLARFLQAKFPSGPRRDLAAFLDLIHYPLAVRSSSLLEDSQYQPFTGVYDTYMLPNNHPDPRVRLRQLLDAVKRVYASTFTQHAKAYLRATPYRLEEEKMGVIIQRIVGKAHGVGWTPSAGKHGDAEKNAARAVERKAERSEQGAAGDSGLRSTAEVEQEAPGAARSGALRATAPHSARGGGTGSDPGRGGGFARGQRFYPDFAGVARSHNFYPTPPLASDDGIVAVGLGLGRTVVEGGNCLRFCPRFPRHIVQFSSVNDVVKNSQREFWALRLEQRTGSAPSRAGIEETRFGLEVAEADGTLSALGSTWSVENNAVYDGISRPGVRLVSFAPILKHRILPLAEIISLLLEIGPWGMSSPVEIEFAVSLPASAGEPVEFGLLQMRPLALSREMEELEIGEVESSRLVCSSSNVMGHGRIDGIHDLIVVDFHRFDRASSLEAAQTVSQFNAHLGASGTPYVLIGVGRWGSADPWLGIPVTWDQISGARAIVEAGFRDFKVTPSQGTHFFQNLTSFNIGYFTVNPEAGEGFVDWDWLSAQPAARENGCVRHLRFTEPVVVKMNGRKNQGLVFKPGAGGTS